VFSRLIFIFLLKIEFPEAILQTNHPHLIPPFEHGGSVGVKWSVTYRATNLLFPTLPAALPVLSTQQGLSTLAWAGRSQVCSAFPPVDKFLNRRKRQNVPTSNQKLSSTEAPHHHSFCNNEKKPILPAWGIAVRDHPYFLP
jgi:hypothetical protein